MEGGLITPPALIGAGPLMGVTSKTLLAVSLEPPIFGYTVKAQIILTNQLISIFSHKLGPLA
jgi:hypothetical protein